MKTKLVILLLLIAAGTLLVLCSNDYRDYRAKKTAERNVLQERLNTSEQTQKLLIAKYNQLFVECKKGELDYTLMTTAEKAKGQVVVCGTSIVE